MQIKVVVPNGRVCTHRDQPPSLPLTSKPEIKPLMCNTNAEPEQHRVPVHSYCGFPVSGSSGHPHPGHKGPVNEEAISLPSSAQSSSQTPREGLGKEEDMSSHLLSSSLTGSCEITKCVSARSIMAMVSQRRWS